MTTVGLTLDAGRTGWGNAMQICPVCIVEMRDAGILPIKIIKVDAAQCKSPIHAILLIDEKKVCPQCGKRFKPKKGRKVYCSSHCVHIDTGIASEGNTKKTKESNRLPSS